MCCKQFMTARDVTSKEVQSIPEYKIGSMERSLSSNPRVEVNRLEDMSDRRSLGWSPYSSDLDAPTHVSHFRDDLDLQHRSQDDYCKHCNRPASKECGVCAMPYCSRRCQLQDFNCHRMECKIPPLVDKKNVPYMKDILKDDNASKLQKGRNRDTSNQFLEKDNKRSTEKEVTKNNNPGWNDYSNENASGSRNHKSEQDFGQNQRDGNTKNNFYRQRNQSGNEGVRDDRDKGMQSNSTSKNQDQEFGTVHDSDKTRESAANTVKVNDKRNLASSKSTEVKDNDAIIVCVEGDERQSQNIPRYTYAIEKLKEGECGIGKIIKSVTEEDTLVLMLTESTKEEYLEIKHLDELVPQLPVDDFKPKIGDLVAAEAEENGLLDSQWGRASVLAVRHDRYLVCFVDHCLVLRTKNIRKLPREIAEIPKFGSKLTILEYKKPVNGNWTQFFKTEEKFPFTVEEVSRNKNVTVAINKGEEKVCRAILSCWSPTSDPNTVLLKDGTEVIIVFFDLEFIYVRPVSISYTHMFVELEEDLCKHCETASQLSCMPSLKSVVACKYGKNSTYYRAQVTDIFKDIIKVYFVDYGNEDAVKLESLKSLSDDLKLYPFMAEKILLNHLTQRDLTAEAIRLLYALSEEKTKLKVKLSNEVPSGMELILKDGMLLGQKLNSFFVQRRKRELIHAPKKEMPATECKTKSSSAVERKSESSPATKSKSSSSSVTTHSAPSTSTDKIYRMDKDLQHEGLPIGITVELLILHKFNATHFTCCCTDSTALKHCIETLPEEISAYCEECEEQYRPKEIGELCLAKFEDDGMWYRAVCVETADENAEKVKIIFIDYGNAAEAAICHLRKMTPNYIKTPAVAHLCVLRGSEQMSEAEKDVVGNLVEVAGSYKAIVIEKNTSSYVVEMLHVTKALSC